MLVELRERSQVTIPSEIVRNLGVSNGDKFEVYEKDGGVFLCPVVIYPKEKLSEVARLVHEASKSENISIAFDSVEDMFKSMGINLDEA